MTYSQDDFYSDDPTDGSASPVKKKFPGFVAFLLFVFAGGSFLQTTLAANISLNSGSPVEFGQGVTQTTACSGATDLTITPYSSFTNTSGAGAFYFSSVKVSNIPTSVTELTSQLMLMTIQIARHLLSLTQLLPMQLSITMLELSQVELVLLV